MSRKSMWPNHRRNACSDQVIYMIERNLKMAKKEMIRLNPLRLLGYDADDVLPKGGFGAIMARAGVGKTAFLVQLAMDRLLQDLNVLHISIDEPVEKVCLWYEEVFKNMSALCRLKGHDSLWDDILPHRFIMTFRVEGFSAPKLEERIGDLTEQGIFFPQLLIIDGFPFESASREMVQDIKIMTENLGISAWFTVRTHRHEAIGPDGVPLPLKKTWDLFEVVIELRPDGKDIHVKTAKGGPPPSVSSELILDPSTMLLRDRQSTNSAAAL